jgi:uncharacterized protein with PQ loop repeat
MDVNLVLQVLALIGTSFSVFFSLSPIPRLAQAWKSRSLDAVSHIFLVSTNVNAIVWLVYSIRVESSALAVSNSALIVTTTINLVLYHMINHDPIIFFAKYVTFATSLVTISYRVLSLH